MTLEPKTPKPVSADASAGAPGAATHVGLVRRIFSNHAVDSSLTLVAFLAIFAGYGIWLGSLFLSVDARLLDLHQNVPILVLGLAVLVTLLTGLFDLSVASMATLTTYMTIGLTTRQELPFWLVLVITLGIGVLGGLANGILVEVLRVNTFIATLGTGAVFAGISTVYSDGAQVVVEPGHKNVPQWFADMGALSQKAPGWLLVIAGLLAVVGAFVGMARFRPARLTRYAWVAARAGIVLVVALVLIFVFDAWTWLTHASWLIALLIFLTLLIWILVEFTTYGRYLRAIGSNRAAARLAGVMVEREVIKAFMLGGFLAALAGVFLAASQGAASPDIAASFLLPAFAAAFLSTVILSTGRFNVWGTIVGGVVVVWVSQGLIIGGMPAIWTGLVNGFVLLAAVSVSTVMRRSRH